MTREKSSRARLAEIGSVLTSYGFSHVYRTRLGKSQEAQDAANLRLAFEELGPTFIKFGQILSTRPDLLPADYIKELSKLQDQAPPFSFTHIQETFEQDFNETLDEAFEWVDETPLASASIAQIHRARTFDGQEVIIKVQRPDMEENLLKDIQLFSRILSMAPETIISFVADAEIALAEIERTTKLELDFRNEVNAIVKFRENNKNRPVIGAPKPLLKYTSKRVLVEEYVEGINRLDIQAIASEGYDQDDFIKKFIYTFLIHIFEDGFFHGDPHPGNVIIRNQQIVYIDFGLYGELSEDNRKNLLSILDAIVFEDIDALMNLLLQIAIIKDQIDRYELYQDLENFFYLYVSKNLRNLDIAKLFNDILNITRKHGLIMPNDFVMLAKSLGIIEGVVSDLDASVNVMDVAKSYVKSQNEFSPFNRLKQENLDLHVIQLSKELVGLPGSLRRSFETIAQGRTRLNLEILNWDQKSIEVNKMVNRLVFAIIIAALILASAVIIVSGPGTGLTRLSVTTFIGAGLMGLWLLISIIKSGTL